jgi:protein-L-isoaspartate O-methyltransferase
VSAERARRKLVAGLVQRGGLSPRWRPAFEHVARHAFLPDTTYRLDRSVPAGTPDLVPLRRSEDPGGWLARAYADNAVITQVDEGHPDEHGRGREASSSASAPAMVAAMLEALDAEVGMRVLEIGTGTGYNAALLAYRLGAGNVTSIEIDPALAAHARERLTAAGYGEVNVIHGDGTEGWSAGAPYDRVIATVAAQQVPYAWIEHTRPGGVVLLPSGSRWWPHALLRLTVDPDGVGHGRIVGWTNFMELRSQRLARWTVTDILGGGHVETSTTELYPGAVINDQDAGTAIGYVVPDCIQYYVARTATTGRLNIVDQATRSWARITLDGTPAPYKVEQAGPRQLWNEVTAAYHWWLGAGKPAVTDWLITIGPNGQTITLDHRSNLTAGAG